MLIDNAGIVFLPGCLCFLGGGFVHGREGDHAPIR